MTIDVGRVAMVLAKDVVVEDRTREVMGDLNEMEENMKESGLITPLTMQALPDEKFKLLAGGRRFAVLERNEVELIPARIYDRELSALELKIIEKSENFHRKDMEYWEMDQLTLEIHRMRQEMHGEKSPGPGSDGWGTRDTAKEIGAKSPMTVVESIKRAELREDHPELFQGIKTANDATKLISKLNKAVETKIVAQQIEESTANTSTLDLAKRYRLKDFFEGVKEIPDEIMNFVEIDPPYGISIQGQKKSETVSQYTLGEYNEVDPKSYQAFMRNVFEECYRVMAEHSWLVCWFAPEPWFEMIYQELTMAGFTTTRMCGIWTKGYGQSNSPNTRLANSYEMFFYAWKGKPSLNKPGKVNEFKVPPIPPQQKTHPTERPVALMQEIYETFTFHTARVLIPFLGSGNGIIAAHRLGMDAIGFEVGKTYKDSFLVKVNSGTEGLK